MKKRKIMKYLNTKLEHWNDLSMLSNRFISAFAFRGQANSEWNITSSLERLVNRLYPPKPIQIYSLCGFEKEILNEFKWKYPIYEKTNKPDDDEIIEWFSLMQHYGCATRMVDFTYSPYVALFMALDNSDYEYSSIWCINNIICMDPFSREHNQNIDNNMYHDKEQCKKYIYDRANKMLIDQLHHGTSSNTQKRIYLIQPHRINERINSQQGLFAIPENPDVTFEENVFPLVSNQEAEFLSFKELIDYSYSPEGIFGAIDFALIKIDIPNSFRYDLIKSLLQMNITAETMFPGLEGLAKSLNYPRYEIQAMGNGSPDPSLKQ